MQKTPNEKLAILIVDSHELVREGMTRLLNDAEDIEIVGQLSSGEELLEYLSRAESSISHSGEDANVTSIRYQMPDIIMLDARMSCDAPMSADARMSADGSILEDARMLRNEQMPGLDGAQVTRAVLKHSPDCKIIAMSSLASVSIPSQMLRSGAHGFITKSISIEELLQAVRIVGAGAYYVTPSVATQLAVNPFDEKNGDPFEKLSKREVQVSQMLSDGLKVSQIATDLHLSPKTVYAYRYRVFEKLGIRSDVELTILALKHGLAGAT